MTSEDAIDELKKKTFSLMHTDCVVKCITNGQRTFTFHEDDAARCLYVLRAYNKPNRENTNCNGKAEAIVKKVKALLNKHEVRHLEHMNEVIKQFQKEYNNNPHSSLK